MPLIPPIPEDVRTAYRRIAPYIHHTPLYESTLLNRWLGGHRILFKMECLQKTGSFKVRGALNTALHLKEQGNLPEKFVTLDK